MFDAVPETRHCQGYRAKRCAPFAWRPIVAGGYLPAESVLLLLKAAVHDTPRQVVEALPFNNPLKDNLVRHSGVVPVYLLPRNPQEVACRVQHRVSWRSPHENISFTAPSPNGRLRNSTGVVSFWNILRRFCCDEPVGWRVLSRQQPLQRLYTFQGVSLTSALVLAVVYQQDNLIGSWHHAFGCCRGH